MELSFGSLEISIFFGFLLYGSKPPGPEKTKIYIEPKKKKRFWLTISAKPSFESSWFRYQMCKWRNTQMIPPCNHSNHPSHSSLPRWGPTHYRAEISPTLCVLFKFLIYRDFKHNKMTVVLHTRLGEVCMQQ